MQAIPFARGLILRAALRGDRREKKYWLALPGICYCAYLLATGSFPEAVLQLTAQRGVLSAGVESYLNYAFVLGVSAGSCSMFLLSTGAVPLLRAARAPRYAR